jgi:hypothetical protein
MDRLVPAREQAPSPEWDRRGKPIRKEEKMIRNLKVLGLALVAVFAFSAMAASGASAQLKQGILTTENGGAVTLDGKEDGKNFFKDPTLEEGKNPVECPGSTFVGHRAEVTPHELILNKATEATITPTFIACHSGAHKATVTMNECDFKFKIGTTTKAEEHSPYALTASVVCPKEKFIDIEVYFSETNENLLICTYKVGPQEVKGFDIANEVENFTTLDTLTATGTGKVIADRSSTCGTKAGLETEQTINATITGTTATGAKNGETITD